jgi:hypothetical protein
MVTHGITLGPDLLKNNPSDALIDWVKICNDPDVTLQVGQELSARDYMYTANIYDRIVGTYTEQPELPGYGYTSTQGMWVWCADSADSETGTWIWILKTESYYVHFFNDHQVG